MVHSHLTLAALATSAMPELNIVATDLFTTGTVGDYDSAILRRDDGSEYLIRIPTSDRARLRQDRDLRGTIAMHAGLRSRLPFLLPKTVGHVDLEGTEGYIYEYVPGEPVYFGALSPEQPLVAQIGSAIAAIHELPTSFVDDYALPHHPASERFNWVSRTLDELLATKRVPRPVAERWEEALAFEPLWRFDTTVCNGDLSERHVLVHEGRLSGILGWAQLQVNDPAVDLSWFAYTAVSGLTDALFGAYTLARGDRADPSIRQRASLYAEVAMGRWLLYGVERGDAGIVADGEAMLARLAEDIYDDLLPLLVVPRDDNDPEPPQPRIEYHSFDVADALRDLQPLPPRLAAVVGEGADVDVETTNADSPNPDLPTEPLSEEDLPVASGGERAAEHSAEPGARIYEFPTEGVPTVDYGALELSDEGDGGTSGDSPDGRE